MAVNYNKVEICGVDTSKLPVISEKEKLELIKKAHAGDKNARDKMITCNLRLVLSVVQKFAHRGENLDDLFQVGCIGLVKAIDNFNEELLVKFSTYGVPMTIECRENINGAIFPTFYGEYRFFIMRFVLRYFVSSWQDEDEHQLHHLYE